MYGFTAYGTNAYASHRPYAFIAPVIQLALTTWQSTYGVVIGLMNTYNKTNTLEL